MHPFDFLAALLPVTEWPNAGALSILGLGFVLGLRHALDADHLVAVSTIVSERKGFLSSSIVGALWGIGHTFSLFVVGLLVVALQIQIPGRVAQGMEFAVAVMLVVLGGNVLWKLLKGGALHMHEHEHDGHHHVHPHLHEHQHGPEHGLEHSHHPARYSRFLDRITAHMGKGKRSIIIGMVHGMAGSAALMLIVLAAIPSPMLGILYIAIFGVGSMGGMFIMSTLIGIPFVVTAQRSQRLNLLVRGIAGVVSLLFGLFLAWQIGFVERLFL